MIEHEILKIKAIPVLFVRKTGSYEETPEQAWKVLIQFAEKTGINLSDSRHFGMGLDDPSTTKAENLRFDACITAPKEIKPEGEVSRQVLKGGRYAIFEHKGSFHTLPKTYDRIFKEWYPEHKDELDESPSFCEHINVELMDTKPDELITKIYIPMK